ncbi:MAG: threonylcarbamoyl-AMP synthase [Rhodospirillaceae bacterium]|nr:threonylcarbamoyl-AMP synthase [Rhodospirillaceae bacterium]
MRNILPLNPDSIARAANAIRDGDLVAFPTETVYGLGADATNDAAVAKIFEAKNRPTFNPLIIHIPDMDAARAIADISPTAADILKQFWPGSLSAILPRAEGSPVSRLASAGLDTLAIRIPAHDGARALLRAARTPIAAPSANSSGRISPTTAQHVAQDLGEKVAIILDGGPCTVGVESTILDLTGDQPAILRPGGVTLEAIEEVLGHSVARGWMDAQLDAVDENNAPTAPGMLRSHYAPAIPVRLDATHAEPGEALLGFGPTPEALDSLSPKGDLTEAAARLFDCLHRLDDGRFQGIAVAPIPDHGLGRAINDRLRRAAAS